MRVACSAYEQGRSPLRPRRCALTGAGLAVAAVRRREGQLTAVEEERQREVCGLSAAPFLYDIGRSRETQFDPKTKTDCFYNAYQARKREMRRGGYRSMSQDIGDGAWDLQQKRETFGRSHATAAFYSKSHIECGDI